MSVTVIAELPPKLIEGGIATPGLLTIPTPSLHSQLTSSLSGMSAMLFVALVEGRALFVLRNSRWLTVLHQKTLQFNGFGNSSPQLKMLCPGIDGPTLLVTG